MGPEIRTPVAAKVAPHRQYVPAARPAGLEPARRGPAGPVCRASPRPAGASSCRSCGRWHSSGCCWRSSSSTGSRAAPSRRWRRSRWRPCRSTTCSPIAGRSRCFVGDLDRRAVLGLRHRARPRSSLGLAAVLIGVCYLPVAWTARAAARRRAGRRPGACRAPRPSPPADPRRPSGPCSATMFMFRMIIYLYELKHAKSPETAGRHARLLLPAAELLLPPLPGGRLPDASSAATSPTTSTRSSGAGLQMMFRGTIHLLLYRLVYHELLIPRRRGPRRRRAWRATSSATTCSTCGSRASSTWPAACSTCSASSSPRRTTITCWRPGSPTTGGGSTSTGRTSWSGSSSTRWSSG